MKAEKEEGEETQRIAKVSWIVFFLLWTVPLALPVK